MKANKIVLCIDWSNICFRSLFINQIYGGGQSATFNDIEDCRSFTYKFATDVCSIINIFRPNDVVILADSSHAWRKDVLETYKGNRVKSPNVNWDNIFKCSDDLKAIFKKQGCHIAEYDHAEADDMAALCKECVFEKYPDKNVIIVSADADLRQLIEFNSETGQYCIVYNTTTKGNTGKRYLYVDQKFMDWYNAPDKVDIFFSNVDNCKQYMKNLLTQNPKIAFEVTEPNEILIHKIFCGDDGDSVPAFYKWANNGKFVRITSSKEKKIRSALSIDTIQDLVNSVGDNTAETNRLKPVFESVCKKSIEDIDFKERINLQRTLVELNSELFPKEIRDYKETVSFMVGNENSMPYPQLKVADIMKGTEYEHSDRKKAIEADVFKDMSKYGLF